MAVRSLIDSALLWFKASSMEALPDSFSNQVPDALHRSRLLFAVALAAPATSGWVVDHIN